MSHSMDASRKALMGIVSRRIQVFCEFLFFVPEYGWIAPFIICRTQ